MTRLEEISKLFIAPVRHNPTKVFIEGLRRYFKYETTYRR